MLCNLSLSLSPLHPPPPPPPPPSFSLSPTFLPTSFPFLPLPHSPSRSSLFFLLPPSSSPFLPSPFSPLYPLPLSLLSFSFSLLSLPFRVIMVVGAGRGPLVDASLRAALSVDRRVMIYAVEKNPGAVVT